jgi:TatD DNase family protein
VIDSHCHLADEAFSADLPDVVARARESLAGALCILAPDDPAETPRAARVRDLWPGLRFATGVTPHAAGQFAGRVEEVTSLVQAAADEWHPSAIGEIGLDYHYDLSPRPVQQEVFRRQVRIAVERRLPIVIHTREADEDTLRILDEEDAGRVGGVFHCFTGESALARRGLDLGFHISFAGIVTFRNAQPLRDVAREIPSSRLLIETDAPSLAPIPFRGKRNEPAWVRHVLQTLADVRAEPAGALERTIDRTFAGIFAARE